VARVGSIAIGYSATAGSVVGSESTTWRSPEVRINIVAASPGPLGPQATACPVKRTFSAPATTTVNEGSCAAQTSGNALAASARQGGRSDDFMG
jgi:hypothetical protein